MRNLQWQSLQDTLDYGVDLFDDDGFDIAQASLGQADRGESEMVQASSGIDARLSGPSVVSTQVAGQTVPW